LLHPFMPFITEEIWQHLPHGDRSPALVVASWPCFSQQLEDERAAAKMELVMDVIKAVRNLRSEMKIAPSRRVEVVVRVNNEETGRLLAESEAYFARLAAVEKLRVRSGGCKKPRQAVSALVGELEVYLPLAGLVDLEEEINRLSKEKQAVEKDLARVQKKLSNHDFLTKAPAEVVAEERQKEELLLAQRQKLAERQQELQE